MLTRIVITIATIVRHQRSLVPDRSSYPPAPATNADEEINGVTAYTGTPGSQITDATESVTWSPDLVRDEPRLSLAILVKM